jgi:hypothetical protein
LKEKKKLNKILLTFAFAAALQRKSAAALAQKQEPN